MRRQDRMFFSCEERLFQRFNRNPHHASLPRTGCRYDAGGCRCAPWHNRPEEIARSQLLYRPHITVSHQYVRSSRVAKPVTSGRGNAEDLRSGPVVRDRFLLDRVDVARDDASVHVQPELALVNPADATQANLALADLAIAGTRRAHDLVRALDRLPELGDLPGRLARRLPDIEDFRFRNHRLSVHWSYRVKTLCGSESSDASEYFRSTHRMHLI